MNRTIGAASAAVCLLAVLGLAVSMPFGWNFGSCLFSMLIALGFVPIAALSCQHFLRRCES